MYEDDDKPTLGTSFLAEAHLKVLSRLQLLTKEKPVNDPEIIALHDINQHLFSMLNQRSWHQYHSTWQAQSEENRLTQSAINAFNKKNHIDALQYTYDQTIALREKLTNRNQLYQSIDKKLLMYLIYNIARTVHLLTRSERSFDTTLQLSAKEQNVYSGKKQAYYFAQLLNARYIIHDQHFSPLATEAGFCCGDVLQWFAEIQEFGKSFSSSNADTSTHLLQKKQAYGRSLLVIHNDGDMSRWRASHEIISLLKSDSLYLIALKYSINGHALGVRTIPGTPEIECRDPNLGTFIFKNASSFHYFFYQLINSYSKTKTIHFYKSSSQPKTATASIPNIIPEDMPEDFFSNCQTESMDEFKKTLHCFAYGLFDDKAITKIPIEEQLTLRLTQTTQIFKQFILTSFKKHLPYYQKNSLIPYRYSKKYLDDYHQALKAHAILYIKAHINHVNHSQLNALIQAVQSAKPQFTLMSIVDHWLNDNPGTYFLENFLTQCEISPAYLTLLQEKTLRKIIDCINSILEKNNQTQQYLPFSIDDIAHALIQYANGENPYTGELIHRMQQIAADHITMRGQLKRSRETILIDDFYKILVDLKPFNPNSLNHTYSSLVHIEESLQKLSSWFTSSQMLLKSAWLMISGTLAGFGGFSLGAMIGTAFFPIIGTIIGAFVGMMIGKTVEWLITTSQNKLRVLFATGLSVGASASIGSLLGSLIFPGIGTLIGGFIGGLLAWGWLYNTIRTPEANAPTIVQLNITHTRVSLFPNTSHSTSSPKLKDFSSQYSPRMFYHPTNTGDQYEEMAQENALSALKCRK